MPRRDLQGIAQAAGADLAPLPKRGVAGMLSFRAGAALENARRLPLRAITVNPAQARQHFDPAALDELRESIRIHGVLQPIGVVHHGDAYQIIFGERRYRAAELAGLLEIPALVYEDLDESEIAILTTLENLQREDLDLEDEARQFARLLELTGLSQRALADHLGKSHNYLSRRIRLLKERPDVFAAIREGRLTQREALDTLADERVYHGDTGPASGGGAAQARPRVPRAALDAARPAAPFRPIERFEQFVQQLQPADVPVDTRAELRQRLEAAITAAQLAVRALDQAADAQDA